MLSNEQLIRFKSAHVWTTKKNQLHSHSFGNRTTLIALYVFYVKKELIQKSN